jgi:glycosyltransferase involved in cell wall biosynthesis
VRKKIGVLQVASGLTAGTSGGVAAFIVNYCKEMDTALVGCDFLAIGYQCFEPFRGFLEATGARVECLGITNFGRVTGNLAFVSRFKRFLQSSQYDIIHVHEGTLSLTLLLALVSKVYGKGARIVVHSHVAKANSEQGALPGSIMRAVAKSAIGFLGDCFLACSLMAGEHTFPKRVLDGKRFCVIKNAIDVGKFQFNAETRKRYRKEFGLNGELLVGHIGRMVEAKNHFFLLDVFSEIVRLRPAARLILVGSGPLEYAIRQRVQDLNLGDKVIFTGYRLDASGILQAMDVLVLPSLYEGLGIVAVEAQAAGLPVIVSSAVPSEAKVTTSFEQMSLSTPAPQWAKRILELVEGHVRRCTVEEIADAGYDIRRAVKELEQVYLRYFDGDCRREQGVAE